MSVDFPAFDPARPMTDTVLKRKSEPRTDDSPLTGAETRLSDDNAVRVVHAFVDELDLHSLGFEGAKPSEAGRPGYHPGVMLKIYIYGYLNRIQSSRRLERECNRNVELTWLTGRLSPDFKTIADGKSEAFRYVDIGAAHALHARCKE